MYTLALDPKKAPKLSMSLSPYLTKILPPQCPMAGSCCKRKQPVGSKSLMARTASCSHGWHFTLLRVFAAPRDYISQGRVPGTLGGGVMTETPKSLQSDHRSDLPPARAGGAGAGRTGGERGKLPSPKTFSLPPSIPGMEEKPRGWGRGRVRGRRLYRKG